MPVISPVIEKSSSGILPGVYRYCYVMNNPLMFTDPSGYMPDWVQDEYDHYYRNGGGGGGGFNYFGWISRSMSYVGWTDNVGPSRADYDYWAANIKGNAAFGEAANSVGKWYQNRRNLNVNWDIALEMGMDFLSTAYQYGGNDVFYTNSSGRSDYLRSKWAVLADYYSDMALLSYMELLTQSPRNYGMMLGDPPAADGGDGQGTDQMGIDVNYGFGVGLKSPYGTAQVRIANATVWSYSFNGLNSRKSGFLQDDNVLVFSIQYGLPLLNAGGGLTLHTGSGLDLFGTIGVSRFSLFNGLSMDATAGYHLGIIGAEGYMRTTYYNSFIQTVPNARQQFYESTGFMWHLR